MGEYIWLFIVNENSDTLMDELIVYMSWLDLLFIVIVFSSLDALYVALWIKLYIGFTLVAILIVHTWNISTNDADDFVEFIGTWISLSSLAVNSLQFVLLFVVKQTVLFMLKRDKIISVKSSPYVQWVNDIEKQGSVYN